MVQKKEPKVDFISEDIAGATHVAFCFGESGKVKFLSRDYTKYGPKLEEMKFKASLGDSILLDNTIFVGLGERDKFKPRHARKAAVSALGFVRTLRKKEVVIDARGFEAGHFKNLIFSVYVNLHKYDEFKTKKEEDEPAESENVHLYFDSWNMDNAKYARIIAESVNYVRDIANRPANIASPQAMAEEAKVLAVKSKLSYKLLTKKDMQKLGMNALLAVASGSAREPTLPIIEYRAPGAKKTLVLIGKGLTFDSGGISLKPSKGMDEMKFDKSGACAVLGMMKAIAQLKPSLNVIGLMPFTENMPGGSATKPGDIVKAYNGKTIEILNTDAEGRLVLADVLAYAEDKYKPDYIIDLATLTGACVVALGSYASGMLTNDQSFADMVKNASKEGFDEVWQLPLWEEYYDMIKGKYADLKNISDTGEAGTITAAAFLGNFVSKAKWVHLDIAGTAYHSRPIPPFDFGATGAGISVVLETIKLLEKSKA